MEELNKKLAKWANWVYDEGAEYIGGGGNNTSLMYGLWYPPGDHKTGFTSPPHFTESLDACFKWLVPKLEHWSLWWGISRASGLAHGSNNAEVWIRHAYGYAYDDNTTALAFCLALEKLVDAKKS